LNIVALISIVLHAVAVNSDVEMPVTSHISRSVCQSACFSKSRSLCILSTCQRFSVA